MENDGVQAVSILGCGWLGSPLLEALRAGMFEVKGSVRRQERMEVLKRAGTDMYLVDTSLAISSSDGFFDCDVCIVNIPSKDVEGYRWLISKLESCGVKKVILVSSTSVYGVSDCDISEEDSHCFVSSPLLEVESLFTSNNHFRTTILRFGGLIGYSRNPALFFKSGRKVPMPDANVNLIHRDDCINIILSVLQKNKWGETYNCCADTHPTKREFYTHAALSAGLPPPEFSSDSPSGSKVVSNRKVKQDLAYEFVRGDLIQVVF